MIIGITGTIGAGKGTLVEHLIKKYGFSHFAVRDFLVKEIKKRGMEISRTAMTNVGNDLRKIHGPSFIAQCLYKEAKEKGGHAVIESLRVPAEITYLKSQEDFMLFALDAPRELRYKRITKRGQETDALSYEKFIEEEEREMRSTDPAKQNLSACISMADYVFQNTNTLVELEREIDQALQKNNIQ